MGETCLEVHAGAHSGSGLPSIMDACLWLLEDDASCPLALLAAHPEPFSRRLFTGNQVVEVDCFTAVDVVEV